MGHGPRARRDIQGGWVRHAVKAAGALAALCGLLVVTAGQAAAAAVISVSVISDTATPIAHLEGVSYSIPVATFTDSAACGTSCKSPSVYTASIQWGDNTPATGCPSATCAIAFVSRSGATGTYSITATHAYADEFNCPAATCGFPVHVQVTDSSDLATSGGSGVIAVKDQPFIAGTPPYSFNATVNQSFDGQIGFFQDGNELAQPFDQGGSDEYSVSIDWGDGTATDNTSGSTSIASCGANPGLGSPTDGCQMGVSGSHTYAGTGTFTVTISIADGADLRSLQFQSTATVAAPDCVGNIGGTHFYTLDGFGGLHPDGVAAAATGSGYWKNWDIARGIAVFPDAQSSGGYVLDAWGGLHPFSVGTCSMPATVTNEGYWKGKNLARGIALAPWATHASPAGYTLDAYGGVHPFGDAPAVSGFGYWKGQDLARGIVISPDSTPGSVGGYTLDAYGGVHPFGNAVSVATPAYFKGKDIARGIVLLPSPYSTHTAPAGYTLDGYGGIHAFGLAPAVTTSGHWGFDAGRAIILLPGSNSTSAGGYVMDLYGGPHQFGTAPAMGAGTFAYWKNWAIARGLGSAGQGTSVRKI